MEEQEGLKEGDKVEILLKVQTPLGYSVLINETYDGLLYSNEIFSDVEAVSYTHLTLPTILLV